MVFGFVAFRVAGLRVEGIYALRFGHGRRGSMVAGRRDTMH